MRAVTLMEILIAIIIMGFLVTLSVSYFGPYKEGFFDREAKANLRLIQAAQKIYRMENSFYYPYSGVTSPSVTELNDCLKLSLPTITKRAWDYLTKDTGCGQASRFNAPVRYWRLLMGEDDPQRNTCP